MRLCEGGGGGGWGKGVNWCHLLMILYEELASLELLGVHHIKQLSAGRVGGLQILPVELLQSNHNLVISCRLGKDN